MSKYEDGSYGSLPGIALIAKVLAGRCQMKYTRVAVGKGYIPDEETPKTMTEPAEYVMDASIVGVTKPCGRRVPGDDHHRQRQCGNGVLLYRRTAVRRGPG